MGDIKYFGYKSWADITREERYFCSHLYHSVLGKEKEFVKWLNVKTRLNLNEDADWEIGFEVCFYRDYLKSLNKSVKQYRYSAKKLFPQKRTFDLCLFSLDRIVIIEAKVQEKFYPKQLDDLENDKKMVKELIRRNKVDIKVDALLLHSNKYFVDKRFGNIYWDDINLELFINPVFEKAFWLGNQLHQ